MLIDPKTGQKILPNTDRGASHYHLMIDALLTGLHHANLQPDDFGEHEHQAHQVTVLFGEACVMSAWHSDTGHRLQSQVRSGQCYVVPSEQPHGLIVDHAGELVNFYLTPNYIIEVLPESDRGRSLHLGNLKISDDLFIRQLAATIRTDRLMHGSASKLLVESATNVLAFYLVNQYATTKIKLIHPDALSAYHLKKVKAFIAAEGTRDISIADLAKVTNYSTVHFSPMFKLATGQTPHQYLINYRIDQAKQLLQTTEIPIVDIAYQVGFNSHAHFSTQFRRIVGVTPQAYRVSFR